MTPYGSTGGGFNLSVAPEASGGIAAAAVAAPFLASAFNTPSPSPQAPAQPESMYTLKAAPPAPAPEAPAQPTYAYNPPPPAPEPYVEPVFDYGMDFGFGGGGGYGDMGGGGYSGGEGFLQFGRGRNITPPAPAPVDDYGVYGFFDMGGGGGIGSGSD